MMYCKEINGELKISSCKYIELNGYGVSNPTEEMIYAAGWSDYIMPTTYNIQNDEAATLESAIINKVKESNDYADSSAVKSVNFNGTDMWATPAERDNYLSTLMSAKRLGIYTIPFFGIELDTDTAINIIDTINVWAMQVTAVKNTHEKNIKNLNSIEDLNTYDFTIGYPEKLVFNTNN